MITIKKLLLPSAISCIVAGTAGSPAFAQNPTDSSDRSTVTEEVVVTGIRASLQRAQELKMQNTSVVEVISAEDIGKLPDSSIAESIARLPGLAAQRLDGRASSVSVRGLGEDFSATTFNGREQVSIGDNRGVEFDLYPSEIMGAVVVHKTPDASLMTQGIGGTIDLQSVRPLDHGTQSISATLRGEYNDIGKLNADGDDTGVRGSVGYIDQFADNTIGVALTYAHMDSPNQEERWQTWGFPEDADGNFVLGGAKPFVRSSTLTRDTVMGVLQFQPNDKLDLTLDALYIDFRDDKILRGIEIPAAWGQGSVEALQVEDGFVTEGIIHDQRVVVRNDFEKREAEMMAFGGNLAYTLTDNWSVEADISHSRVDRRVWSLESYSGTGRGDAGGVADDIHFSLKEGAKGATFTPGLDYSDDSLILLTSPLSWGGGNTFDAAADDQDGFINLPEIEDELTTLRLSAERAFDSGMFSSVEFGVNLSDREKTKQDRGLFLTLPQYPDSLPVPDEYRVADTSLDFIGMGEMVSYDSFAFYSDGNYVETEASLTDASRTVNSWVVAEEVTTGYIKGNIQDEWFGLNIIGNIGLQAVSTKQSSDGNAVTIDENGLAQVEKVYREDTYTEFLPSLNLNAEVADAQFVRLGLSRTLSRSRMDRMNSSFGYSFNDANNIPGATPYRSPWSGNGGNTDLRPYIANQFDLTYENYFSTEGYYSAAVFYKDLTNWQFETPTLTDFSGVPTPNGQDPVIDQGIVSSWENTEGGFVKGLELSASLPGSLVSDALDGFGAILSATYLDSSVSFDATTSFDESGNPATETFDINVPGLSEAIYNATVYYEKRGFQVRASMRKRSDFQGEVSNISFTRIPVNVLGNEIVDAQISYDFAESGFESLQGLTLTLQGQNLTDEPFITTVSEDDDRLIRDYQQFGRNFLLGASYKF
jgi:iron complex outermembrane receptor protein